ncbi:penicillin-binding protein [Ferruginibacter yonginensis]|uniref:Penicillin-binding protein n=1 Tax=Ferruginibacter yonginensis TaxID=1310416 RepID=A0ABV8QU97_9BACT
MDIKKDILWRVYLCFLCIVVLCVFVLGRAIYIQRAEGKFWIGMGDSLHLKYQPILAERGSIYSEDGNMLSTSIPIFDVFVDFAADGLREKQGKRFKDNVDSLSICLANLFADKTSSEYKKLLQQAYKESDRYFILKKKMTFDQYLQLRNFPLVRLGRNKSGFIIESKDKRINPYVLLANRTIGLSRQDVTKNVGLELTYDSLLRGTTGQRLMRYAAGTYMPVEGAELDPVNGKDIVTTLDTYIQDVTENALMNMMVGNNSVHGTAIVMETATGKIKAIANLGKQPDGTYLEDLNYGIGKKTEPGSVFKLATLMSLMEDKYVDLNTIVNCEGGIKSFSGLRIKDSHLGTYETTVKEAFAASSNVAFAKLASQYYGAQPQKFLDHLHKMRLDTLTGVEIIASSGFPLIKKLTSKSWSGTTIPYMAHGYEELVTPLNMLTLYNAVANNGKMMRPYLVNEIRDYGVTIQKFEPQVLDAQICSPQTVAMLKEAMLEVVESVHGTAHAIKDSVYKIAGKTGTAVTALDNKGYNKGAKIYQASFIGYFPAEAPRYTIAVVIQNSRESKLVYGAAVSGAVFKQISDKLYTRYLTSPTFNAAISKDTLVNNAIGLKNDVNTIFSYMRIPMADQATNGTWRNVQLAQNTATLSTTAIPQSNTNIMPSVVGMGLKDAVYVLENKGLKIAFQGKGKVISQDVLAGSNFIKGQKITLFLN